MRNITKWRKVRVNVTQVDKQRTCVLCGEAFAAGEELIRPIYPGLDKPVSPCHKTTWAERPPFFHRDCFCHLRKGFAPAVPVHEVKNHDWVPIPNHLIESWCQCAKGK